MLDVARQFPRQKPKNYFSVFNSLYSFLLVSLSLTSNQTSRAKLLLYGFGFFWLGLAYGLGGWVVFASFTLPSSSACDGTVGGDNKDSST